MSQLLLTSAVVVHLPDFLGAAAVADEIKLGFGNPGDAAAQAKDNFVGEAMGDQAGIGIGGRFAILLAQHLWRLRILGVVQPALDIQRSALDAQIAEGQHAGIGRRAAPVIEMHFLGSARHCQGIKALGHHVENPRRLQIIPQSDIEDRGQILRARIGGDQLEVGHGETDLLDTQSGAGANPVLSRHSCNGKQDKQHQ